MSTISVTMFGGLQIHSASRDSVRPATRKAQALLAYLAIRPGVAHARDKLAAILWGSRGDAQARDSLRHALTEVRKALGVDGADALIARDGTVALHDGVIEVDTARFSALLADGGFDHLQSAAALYRGDLLDGLVVDERPFEEWVSVERVRFRELASEALGRLLTQQSERGELGNAVQTAVRLLELDPLREPAHRSLMDLYARQGRRGAALRQYQVLVASLKRELGVEPEPETTTLYGEIVRRRSRESAPVRHAGGGRGEGESGAASAERLVKAPEIPLHEAPLFGRSGEVATLTACLEDVTNGEGRTIVITGEAGVGKSRLVADLTGEALARRAQVLLGRCHPSTQILPFGPWVEALRSSNAVAPALVAGLERAWQGELVRLLPELASPLLPPPSDNPLHLFEAIVRLLRHLSASRPLVVVIEDGHWADEMTLRLAVYLSRRIAEGRIMLITTVREDEPGEPALAWSAIAELRSMSTVRMVALEPLARPEMRGLVQFVLGPGVPAGPLELAEARIWAASEGNPFVALEVMRSWGSDASAHAVANNPLPERVRGIVAARLAGLGHTARRLVGVAAAMGRETDFLLLQRVADLAEEEAAVGIEELVRRGIFRVVGERFHFSHDRIREVAYGDLLPQRRRLLHSRIATALESATADERDRNALALAQHWAEAGLWDKSARYWQQAAAQAVERASLRLAAECLESAIGALERLPSDRRDVVERSIDARLALRAALFAGRSPTGRVGELLSAAAALSRTIGDERRLARALVMQSHYYGIIAGDLVEGDACARQAIAIGEAIGAPGLATRGRDMLGRVQHGRGAYDDAIAAFRAIIGRPESGPSEDDTVLSLPPALGSRIWLVFALTDVGEIDEAIAMADEVVSLVDDRTHPYRRYHAHWARLAVHLERGEADDAKPDLQRIQSAMHETDMPRMAANAMALEGHLEALAGRPDQAIALLEHALFNEARDAFAGDRDIYYLADAYLRAGRLDDALRLAERSLALSRSRLQPGREARALRLLASIHSARDDRDAATLHYDRALALAVRLGLRPIVAHCRSGLAELAERAGDARLVQDHASAATALYQRLRMPRWQRDLDRCLSTGVSRAS